VDLAAVAEKSIPVLRPLAEHRNVDLRLEAESEVLVCASEDDLYQIVFNLAENAIKYNVPHGEVTVSVKKRDGAAVLTVADTGIGIPQEDVPNIFSRFYRVDKARSREAGGSGLGLSIVRDAVILHGGDVSVTSNVPQGTVFTVTLPLYDERG
jgi:signal transduction histidine kinase